MNDLISRQAAIDAAIDAADDWDGGCSKERERFIREALEELPSAEPTLYGYKIEHLAYIARVMEKEGITAEYAVRTFNDMGRVIRMIVDEAEQTAWAALTEDENG